MNELVLITYTILVWFAGGLYGAFIFEYRNQNRTIVELAGDLWK